MMVDGMDPGVFRTSFLDRGLVTFAECVEHYQALEPDALLDEMRLLLTAPMLAVPFGVASARYYALMGALVRCTGTDRSLSDTQCKKLVRICIDIGTFLRGRAGDDRAKAFEAALAWALDAVRASPVRPEIADEIATGICPSKPCTRLRDAVDADVDEIQTFAFDEPPPGLCFKIPA